MRDPDGGGTYARYPVLDEVRNRFNDLAAAFRNADTPLGRAYDQAIAGAGQFSPQLSSGAVKFLLSWREVLDVCEQSAGLIAGNVGKTAVDLKAVDIDTSQAIQL